MSQLKINGKTYSFTEGATILSLAREHSIHIPTMCYLKKLGALTSCFVCVVEVEGKANLIPACSAPAEAGMIITTDSARVKDARRTALELLLSDHTGDCLAPCHLGCPALINIPKFIQELRNKDNRAAITTIKENVALPAVLGRICPEICERVCRRRRKDAPVAICHLKRYAADVDLFSDTPYTPKIEKSSGKKVAIAGGGTAGVTAAYYLLRMGHQPVIFEKSDKLGGGLRSGVSRDRLSGEVLDRELNNIIKLGVKVEFNKALGKDFGIKELLDKFEAVFLATGLDAADNAMLKKEGLSSSETGIIIDRHTNETNIKGVFAGEKTTLAVRASAHGHFSALVIDKYLKGLPLNPVKRPFSVRMAHFSDEEFEIMIRDISNEGRVLTGIVDTKTVKNNPGEGRVPFTSDDTLKEAGRCMRCDCRKAASCLLKAYSIEYGSKVETYKGEKRGFKKESGAAGLVFEAGKCIMCGICVKICEKNKEIKGFSFVGRGFVTRVELPFDGRIDMISLKTAEECASLCPTGAISTSTKDRAQKEK
ncbi:MAG: 2Fe-2S iron-sulfur cluster-binding protein [Candidatus Firestonebacteria bacterium]|nr:2Fe-2S iron-sulfur cluster-binding protein [Candidatus Firestonebacteria bacterium]